MVRNNNKNSQLARGMFDLERTIQLRILSKSLWHDIGPDPFRTLSGSVPFPRFIFAMASWCTLLVQLLEHPRGISVAENITDSLSHRQRRRDQQQAHSSQPLCMRCSHLEQVYGTTPVSSVLKAPCSFSPCDYKAGEGFHWGCTLCYLVSPTLSINAAELTQAPRFCLLSSVIQCRLLALMISQGQRIPSSAVRNFIAQTKPRLSGEPWCTFLLLKLETMHCQTEETSGEGALDPSTMTTALSPAMLCKVQAVAKVLSQSAEASQVLGASTREIRFVSLQQIEGEADMETSEHDVTVEEEELVSLREEEQEETTVGLRTLQHVVDGSPMETSAEMEELGTDPLTTVRKEGETTHNSQLQVGCAGQIRTQLDYCETNSHQLESVVKDARDTWLTGQVVSQDCFDSFMTLDSKKLERMLCQCDCQNLPEIAVTAVMQNLVSSANDMSYHSAVALLRVTSFHQLECLQQSASRSLLSALSSLVKKHPRVSTDGLLLPLVKCKQFGAAHADLLTKVIKEVMTVEQQESFWKDFISLQHHETPADPYVWNEGVVSVAQVLMDKAKLDSGSAAGLVGTLQRSAVSLKKSSKFAKFLIELINRYMDALSPLASSLVAIASTNESMMKIKLMKTVKKLGV